MPAAMPADVSRDVTGRRDAPNWQSDDRVFEAAVEYGGTAQKEQKGVSKRGFMTDVLARYGKAIASGR